MKPLPEIRSLLAELREMRKAVYKASEINSGVSHERYNDMRHDLRVRTETAIDPLIEGFKKLIALAEDIVTAKPSEGDRAKRAAEATIREVEELF